MRVLSCSTLDTGAVRLFTGSTSQASFAQNTRYTLKSVTILKGMVRTGDSTGDDPNPAGKVIAMVNLAYIITPPVNLAYIIIFDFSRAHNSGVRLCR